MVNLQSFYKTFTLVVFAITLAFIAQSNQTPNKKAAPQIEKQLAGLQQSFSGGYLAGRFAQHTQDWDNAQYYLNAILSHDADNSILLQRAFLLTLGAGNFTKALELAKKISLKDGNELALILLTCDALNQENFKAAFNYIEQLPAEGFGQYTKPLLTAWTLLGLGKKAEALALLDKSSDPNDPTYNMHKGLMEEYSGNMDKAAASYKVAMANGLDLHTAIMVANFYDRYGQKEITDNIYESLDKIYPFNPFSRYHSAKKEAGKNIESISDGAALAMFDLATLLYSKRAYESAQIYGSLVKMLNPGSPFVELMLGDIAALYGQYDKSINLYSEIAENSPVFWLARTRISEVYEISGQLDKSIEILKKMSKETPIRIQILASLGDTYRRHNQMENAIDAYNQALAGVGEITTEHWPIIYARGMAKEKLNHWEQAEKDILQALKFQPHNPMILNFIAYTWASQGVNLDKALEYAEQAASLQPDDGYILDSYGWILFRTGNYSKAVNVLEQAVEQLSGDSTILDHLGDAYWQSGRENEARHQWRKALDLSQDTSFKLTVQQKMKNGIVVPEQIDRQQAKL